MSEKQIVELKEEDRKLLRSNIDALKAAKEAKAPTEHKHEDSKHEHFAVELAYMEKGDACPECVKGLDKFGKEYAKKTFEAQSKEPFVCSDCGFGVKEDAVECSNCGGKDADKR